MKSNVRMLALAAMVAMVGCGEDDGLTAGTLTEAQAAELASAVFSQSLVDAMSVNYQQPAQSPDGPQLATYTATVETTGSCPLGGEVALGGNVGVETNDATGATDVDFTLTLVHAACVVQGEQGTRFTLTGNPSLVVDFLMSSDGQQNTSFDGSISGAVDYSLQDGEPGTCQIAYEFSGEGSANGFSFQTNGTVCGADVSQSLTVSG